ncbi:alpha/beta hydrolase [Subtercola sp. PAMC28395]|uniref:alpha/beta hydrolase n=1 Tax=Subtercola sp. PAMC28395 TaxID=2846775 RepID=UPI001C0B9BFD|nr:alpha/beta hydrolase [Subtercola sp. PAMC28395]QWT24571.1 alpha/beta hydrolase [Subtercola sp. PAMC28395]
MPTFNDEHGVTITYYEWLIANPRAIIQISHGLGEYAERYDQVARELNAAGYSVYANDHRGHGQTGLDQYGGDHTRLGHLGAGGLRATIAGIRQFTEIIRAKHPGMPIVLLAQSWGSLMVQKLLNASSAGYAGAVLVGTAYRMPGSMDGGDLSRRHRPPGGGGTGYEWLSRDVAVQTKAAADDLMFEAKVLKLFGLADGLRLFGRPAKSFATDIPILILAGTDDILGGERSVQKLADAYRKAQLHDVTVKLYPDARHEVLRETNRDEVIGDLIAWLDQRLVVPTTR